MYGVVSAKRELIVSSTLAYSSAGTADVSSDT